jgi:hypothetical protein
LIASAEKRLLNISLSPRALDPVILPDDRLKAILPIYEAQTDHDLSIGICCTRRIESPIFVSAFVLLKALLLPIFDPRADLL